MPTKNMSFFLNTHRLKANRLSSCLNDTIHSTNFKTSTVTLLFVPLPSHQKFPPLNEDNWFCIWTLSIKFSFNPEMIHIVESAIIK